MKDLAILVDNKNDSTEAQDLLFSMGYKWRGLGEISKSYFYPKMNKYFIFMNKNEMDLQMAGYFAGSSRSYAESRFKEITLQELRDMANPMKEYLFKYNDQYTLVELSKEDAESNPEQYIEVPDGATHYATDSNLGIKKNYFFRCPGDAVWVDSQWMKANFSVANQTVLWQRTTHPEELPFIDDEPKIETATGYQLDVVGSNTYGSRSRYDGESDISYRQYLMNFIVGNRAESLNDQYAEIEKVRQSHRTASEIADSALKHIRERAETYDQPTGERSAAKTAKAFNAITGKDITESEVWLLLQLLKDVRQWSREDYHQDSAEDCIAYAALKAESLEGGE